QPRRRRCAPPARLARTSGWLDGRALLPSREAASPRPRSSRPRVEPREAAGASPSAFDRWTAADPRGCRSRHRSCGRGNVPYAPGWSWGQDATTLGGATEKKRPPRVDTAPGREFLGKSAVDHVDGMAQGGRAGFHQGFTEGGVRVDG